MTMHVFILDEMELGTRVAMYLDSENNTNWSALDDVRFERAMARMAQERAKVSQ